MKTHRILFIAMILLPAASVVAELLLVEDFTDKTEAVTIDGKIPNGVLGGAWDTEGESTGNITTRTSDGSMTLRVSAHSSGTLVRGAGIAGLTNPIDNTEAGILFFRFKVASGSRPLQDYLGIHTYTSSSYLNSTTCQGSAMNAGFSLFCAASSATFDIKTIDNATVLKTGLARNQWYNVWIVADNARDTFDLYVNASSSPGRPVELPAESDRIGEGLAFGMATASPLAGVTFGKPVPTLVSGQTEDVFIDDIYWDGDEGLTLTSKGARNPVPAHRAVQVPLDQILSWDAPNDPNVAQIFGYDVYLDPNEAKVAAGLASVRVSTNQAVQFFDPVLAYDTTYYWRVDSRIRLNDPNQTQLIVPSSVWRFTAESSLPAITRQPAYAVVKAGTAAVFTITVESVFPPSYQWYKSSDPANDTFGDDILISGATGPTLTLSGVSTADEGFYYCKVTNPRVAYSSAAGLAIQRPLAHWTLDGLVGGKYADTSGEGHHADPNGTPLFAAGVNPAKTGNAVAINAGSGWANAGSWNPSQYSGQLSISLWVKWAGQWEAPYYQGLIGKRNAYTDDGMMWQLEIGNTSPYNLTFKRYTTGTQTVAATGPLPV
ncbi:MAG TPA: immunoglobulin domain-containing protein, partial [Anaerohalosphaeraceae bacterium]|nr:immunoglobulin domain-containing protein [Anaerohalosphaeraceae bacterium]